MVVMCVLMLWLGVHATFFLTRFEGACQATIQQANPNLKTGATGMRQSQPLNQP